MSKAKKELIGVVIVLAAIFLLLRSPAIVRLLPSTFGKVVLLGKAPQANMPSIKDAALTNVQPAPYPSTVPAHIGAVQIRVGVWEWSAQNGFLLAVGGTETMQDSLMAKFGVNVYIERQDDTGKMQEGLAACAQEHSQGMKQCDKGYDAVIIMGGGSPQFIAVGDDLIRQMKLSPGWNSLETLFAVGRSNGEDACWAPPSYKSDPHSIAQTEMYDENDQLMDQHGLLIEAVVRDDDYNICVNHALANQIPVNTDDRTFDPNAMNVVNASDYITAATDYVTKTKCETRHLVNGNKNMAKDVRVCVNGVATWTPGDDDLTQRGGLDKVASSKDFLMHAVVVGLSKFFSDNPEEIVNMIAASNAAGDQVRAFPEALQKSCDIASIIYKDPEHPGKFWCTYYKGVNKNMPKVGMVKLGGSQVYGLEDNLEQFGIKDGFNDNYAAVYNRFSEIDNAYFPQLFKKTPIPPINQVERGMSYLIESKRAMSEAGTTTAKAESIDYDAQQNGSQISDANYHVEFPNGSAEPLPSGIEILKGLEESLAGTRASIEIDGHTDSTGSAAINDDLSRRRAEAVAKYLNQTAPKTFPMSRFHTKGYGSTKPAQSNATDSGRAANRRVEIILKSSGA